MQQDNLIRTGAERVVELMEAPDPREGRRIGVQADQGGDGFADGHCKLAALSRVKVMLYCTIKVKS